MKQFNLEEYLKNPNQKVVTRDGHPVRIICTDRKGGYQPILALVQVRADSIEVALTFSTDGTYDIGRESNYDLFFAPEKHEGLVNMYKDSYGAYVLGEIFIGKEHEEVTTGLAYIATAKIEWEE